MFERSFVRRSGLGRRVLFFLSLVPIGFGAFLLWFTGPPDENIELLFGAAVLAVVSFGGMSLAVTCPNCRVRLGWRAFQEAPAGQWMHWLMTLKECPSCGHNPITPSNSRM